MVSILAVLLAACAPVQSPTAATAPARTVTLTVVLTNTNTPAPDTATASPLPAQTETLTPTPPPTATSGPTATPGPDDWQKMPVIPTGVSERARLIYQMGQLKGNNPRAFSKVGDCNTTMPYFLGDFDNPDGYQLGEYTGLAETIDYFQGSFSRKSLASKDGLTAHASMSVLWVDWRDCETYETPLTCEYRI